MQRTYGSAVTEHHQLATARKLMVTTVLVHLAISLVHGAVHTTAHVALTTSANVFVITVILAGPLIGLLLSRRSDRMGGVIVAATLAGALVFGMVNHFVLEGSDHVMHVDREWRMLFGTTAALLGATELLGVGFAIRLVRGSPS